GLAQRVDVLRVVALVDRPTLWRVDGAVGVRDRHRDRRRLEAVVRRVRAVAGLLEERDLAELGDAALAVRLRAVDRDLAGVRIVGLAADALLATIVPRLEQILLDLRVEIATVEDAHVDDRVGAHRGLREHLRRWRAGPLGAVERLRQRGIDDGTVDAR